MDRPVEINSEGIKINPEKMMADKIYHCIFKEKVLLFFKDSGEMLNCYEISEAAIVNSVKKCVSDEEVENILQNFIARENLNH